MHPFSNWVCLIVIYRHTRTTFSLTLPSPRFPPIIVPDFSNETRPLGRSSSFEQMELLLHLRFLPSYNFYTTIFLSTLQPSTRLFSSFTPAYILYFQFLIQMHLLPFIFLLFIFTALCGSISFPFSFSFYIPLLAHNNIYWYTLVFLYLFI